MHIAHIIQHPRASDVGVFVVQAILAAICVYVSGTYPLNSVRPCTSVARPTDVRVTHYVPHFFLTVILGTFVEFLISRGRYYTLGMVHIFIRRAFVTRRLKA